MEGEGKDESHQSAELLKNIMTQSEATNGGNVNTVPALAAYIEPDMFLTTSSSSGRGGSFDDRRVRPLAVTEGPASHMPQGPGRKDRPSKYPVSLEHTNQH